MTMNKVLRWVTLLGIFVIPFVPLIINTSGFFPFITGKNFAFRAIVEIILAAWLILCLRDKSYRPQRSYLLIAAASLIVITGLATVFGENFYRSFWSNYERMGGFVNLLHVGAYFLVLISVLRDRIKWFWLANTALAGNWLIIVYSLFQLAGKIDIHQGGVRLDATLGNAAYLAVYLLFNIFVSLYLLNKVKINWAKILYGLTAVVDVFLLYQTATRGTILGLVAGVVVTTGLFLLTGGQKEKKIAGLVLTIIVVLAAGFLLARNTSLVKNSPVLSRFASISLSETTTQSRFLIWGMSLHGFKDHPLLGWGPENYQMVFSKYYDPAMWRQEPWFDRSHNVFLDWLIDAGLLGLLAYLAIFFSATYYLWRERLKFGKTSSFILIGLLVGYLLHNFFVFDNLISYIYFFSLVAFVHFVITEESIDNKLPDSKTKRELQNKKTNDQNLDLSVNVISVIIVVALFGCLYYINYRPYEASINLIKAINPYTSNSSESFASFQKVFVLNTFGSGEAREQLISKTVGLISDPQNSNEVKTQFVKLADEQIKIQIAHSGQDARSYLLFGSFFSEIGNSAQGIDYLLKAKALSPKKQQILFELVGAYVRIQDAPKALALAKEAYDLDPTYPEARKLYAIILILTNKNSLAQEILAPIKNDASYFNDSRFVNLYRQVGNQQALQEIQNLQAAARKK